MRHFLEFEKPIAELEGKIEELRRTTDAGGIDVAEEIGRLGEKAQALLKTTYAKLSPWQKAQVARHPDRPHATDYIAALIQDFTPLAGDRAFADDAAVVGGMGWHNCWNPPFGKLNCARRCASPWSTCTPNLPLRARWMWFLGQAGRASCCMRPLATG